MNKIILTIVCFFCLSLISDLAIADNPEWAGKPNYVTAREVRKAEKKAEKKLRKAERRAKKAEKKKERELRKAEH